MLQSGLRCSILNIKLGNRRIHDILSEYILSNKFITAFQILITFKLNKYFFKITTKFNMLKLPQTIN